jgi:hypothetical protein
MDNSNHNTKNNNGSEPTELFNTLPLIILSIFFGINQILGKIINSYITSFNRYQQFFGKQFEKNGRITIGNANYFAREFGFNLSPIDCLDDKVKRTLRLHKDHI